MDGFGIILSHKAGSAAAIETKQLLPQTGIVEYFPGSAIPDKIAGPESCIICMVQFRRTFRMLIKSADFKTKCV